MYHILSLDGGGVRGMLTCILLERLETARPGFVAGIDLFAGTSVGALLAAGLAAGFSPAQCREMYGILCPRLFTSSLWNRVRRLGNALGARYSGEFFKQILVDAFGDMRLGDLSKKVLIATFHLDGQPFQSGQIRCWRPKFFNNFQEVDKHERIVDVVLRSCAAPTYFSSYQGYLDGGVVTNNPSMSALAQTLDRTTGGQTLENVALLSLGTGRFPKYLEPADVNWGWLRWAQPLLQVLLEGNVGVAHYQCGRLLGERYHRLDPLLPAQVELDDHQRIPMLKQIAAETDLTPTLEWLGKYF